MISSDFKRSDSFFLQTWHFCLLYQLSSMRISHRQNQLNNKPIKQQVILCLWAAVRLAMTLFFWNILLCNKNNQQFLTILEKKF